MNQRGRQKWDQYWACYRVYSRSTLQTVQDALDPLLPDIYRRVPAHEYHVTIHPQFQCPVLKEKSHESYVRELFPSNLKITSDSFHFYPSKAEPRVICLDVDTPISFEDRQRELADVINNGSGETVLDPVTPHITLFSVKDPHRDSLSLPPTTDKIYRTCDRLTNEELPVQFEKTELEFQSIQAKE